MHDAVRTSELFTTGAVLFAVSVHEGTVDAACQFTVICTGELAPAAFLAVTEYATGPADEDVAVQELELPLQPLHVYAVGELVHDAVRVTLLFTFGEALLDTTLHDGTPGVGGGVTSR